MDVFAILGFTFGMSAFTFALIAINQVSELKKEVQQLKDHPEGDGRENQRL